MEYFDIVDDSDNVVGRASRKSCHANPQLTHRAVHIFVFNRDRQLFVQKRGADADLCPSMLDSSAAGNVSSGETYDTTAFRELREELGIDPEMLVPLFKIRLSDRNQSEFVRLYFCYHPGPLRPNTQELQGGEFKNVEQIMKELENGNYTPFFRKIFTKYYREFWFEYDRNGNDENNGH
jgi:isopentenyldiphosphate isomerase